MIAVRVMTSSIPPVGIAGRKIMRHIVGKIGMIAPEAHQRQHELADQHRAADDRADQK